MTVRRFITHFTSTLALAALLVFAGCDSSITSNVEPTPSSDDAAARSASEANLQAIPGEYIVVFNETVGNVPEQARSLANQHGGTLRFVYEHALKGFSAQLPDQAVNALQNNPNVAYVEPNAEVKLVSTQSPVTWGPDRVDQRDLPLSDSYTYPTTGSGVNAYVLDTGVRASHNEFGGRVQYVPNGSNGDFVGDGHGSAEDCHGHGTHVAGSIGGSTYGLAKEVSLWAARVVDCGGSGSVDMAIAAVDWVTANGQQPAVVNMSLGYGDVQSLRDAVENSVAAGFNYAVAAGNGNFAGIPQDACQESPAGAPSALTIGATASDDDEASFSNYGTCVDLLAPGVSVTSAWYTSDTATNTISGTSMASPHTAGAAALYLEANPSASPLQVADALKANASQDKIQLHRRSQKNDTPNRLLYMAFISSGGDTNTPPSADFTYSATDLTVDFTDQSTDSDGSISTWSWDFGDGATSTVQNPSHTYGAEGTYTVTLTVTDDAGATDTATQDVTVSSGSTGGDISLSANGYKVRGRHHIDLMWSGATSTNVDVYRNGGLLTTTANDGAYTDATNNRGNGTYTYQVCEAGTSTCSNEATVTF